MGKSRPSSSTRSLRAAARSRIIAARVAAGSAATGPASGQPAACRLPLEELPHRREPRRDDVGGDVRVGESGRRQQRPHRPGVAQAERPAHHVARSAVVIEHGHERAEAGRAGHVAPQRQHQPAARRQHPAQLPQRRLRLGHELQALLTTGHVERLVGQREGTRVRAHPVHPRLDLPGQPEQPRMDVHAGDGNGFGGGQPGHDAGPARHVEQAPSPNRPRGRQHRLGQRPEQHRNQIALVLGDHQGRAS
jgi:hypothetical protein